MTFASDEISQEDSQPEELYLFQIGSTQIPITNATNTVTFNARDYLPSAINRDQPSYSAEKPASEVTIQIAIGDANAAEIVAAFVPRAPDGLMSVIITQVQPTGSRTFWSGFVISSNYNNEILSLLCRPLSDLSTKVGPRRGYGTMCQHVLFDARCKLQIFSFQEVGTVTAIDSTGLVFTVPGIAAATNRYATGQIKSNVNFAQGMIIDHTGDDFTVRYPIPGIAVGDLVTIVEGCNHDLTDCGNFSNVVNYGGFPYTPFDNNPFEKGVDRT